jgi:hypothetical protein
VTLLHNMHESLTYRTSISHEVIEKFLLLTKLRPRSFRGRARKRSGYAFQHFGTQTNQSIAYILLLK